MSRLTTLSPQAIKQFFSPDADDQLILLLTFTAPDMTTIRLADGFTQKISETDEDIVYGVVSRSQNYIFLPIEVTLPTEEEESAPRASITIHNVTRYLTPAIRNLTTAISVKMEVVLASSPNTVEIEFSGLQMTGIQYDANTVSGVLTMDSFAQEPFPQHTFAPIWFPGLF